MNLGGPWLITMVMVCKFSKSRVVGPFPTGLFMACKMGVTSQLLTSPEMVCKSP